jgi:hypothetical protein
VTGPLLMFAVVGLSLLAMVLGVVGVRWWTRRGDRRSPLHGKLHHVPGQQLLERIESHGDEMLTSAAVMYMAPFLMLLAWTLSLLDWSRVRVGPSAWAFAGMTVLTWLWALRGYARHAGLRRQARDSLAAERMTAQQLNRLVGPDCTVLHDVPADGFNLDHVVIAARGVYAVETKSFRKPPAPDGKAGQHFKVAYDGSRLRFPDWHTDEPLLQARRQAQWLGRYLRDALQTDVRVVPAVALPGWWIDQGRDAAASDVRVFTPMGRGAEFMLGGPAVLDPRQRALIAQALVLRYPDAAD